MKFQKKILNDYMFNFKSLQTNPRKGKSIPKVTLMSNFPFNSMNRIVTIGEVIDIYGK